MLIKNEESGDDPIPIDIDPPPRLLHIVAGAAYIPKHNIEKPAGEDAHFICAANCTVGVADGVGGWAKQGIDSGEYARELMRKAALATLDETIGAVDPKRILTAAYCGTNAGGASTACIVALNGNVLHAANVGDSGFMVFRDDGLLYRSPTQQHKFNKPYQLGNAEHSDRPSSAVEIQVEVMPGDILVVGTDGLSDNLYTDEILGELRVKISQVGGDPRELAWRIAKRAHEISRDKKASTPFAIQSRRAGRSRPGGKVDDITVIVAHIL